ncbi:MAG: TatD family hydrolase, partial [Spirochaetia bacterium]|nr:TatD family hydrolase [Spirochaetia bacterium]
NLLVETDAPYLTPVPMRGKINEPAYTLHTLNFIADLRSKNNGENPEEVKKAIYKNSIRFINLKNTADGKSICLI